MNESVNAARIGWWVALVATPALWFAWWIAALPGHVFNGLRFVLYDQGSYLYAVECALRGEALYSGFAWQYGPLALGWFEAWARVLGNSPQTLILALATTTGLAWIAWVTLAARVTGRGWAWLGGSLLLLPAMSQSCAFSINDAPHGAVEALLLASVAWAVQAACARPGMRWRWLLGATLGVLQTVRFGPHVVAGAAAVVLVSVYGWRERGEPLARVVGRTVLGVAVGYVCVMGPVAVWLAMRLPATMLRELLWPAHMVQHYAQSYAQWLPTFHSWKDFFQVALPVIAALGVTLACIVRAVSVARPATAERAAIYALALPGLYFALALVGLLRSDNAVLGHAWIALPALALVKLEGRMIRWLVAFALVPAAALPALQLRDAARQGRASSAQSFVMPNGQTLWLRANDAATLARLNEWIGQRPQPLAAGERRRLAVFWAGGGVRYFFNTARVGRHWWYLAEFVRPWEQEQVAAELRQHELLLVVTDVPTEPQPALKIWTPLRSGLAEDFLGRLRAPRTLPGIGYLLEIAPEAGAGKTP